MIFVTPQLASEVATVTNQCHDRITVLIIDDVELTARHVPTV